MAITFETGGSSFQIAEATCLDVLHVDRHVDLKFSPDQSIAPLVVFAVDDFVGALTVCRGTYLIRYRHGEITVLDPQLLRQGIHKTPNAYWGISSAIPIGDDWLASVHLEDQADMPACGESGAPGFNASIGLSHIQRTGEAIRVICTQKFIKSNCKKVPLSEIPVAISDPEYPSYAAQGAGSPCLCPTRNRERIRCYYTDFGGRRGGRNVVICVAEGPLSLQPRESDWRKWDGGQFSLPLLSDRPEVPIIRTPDGDVYDAHIQYLEEINCYLTVFGAIVESRVLLR